MSQLQRAIEELSQQLMQAQQEQYPERQEQYLRDKEEREASQHQMEEKQESWQQQMMAQQQEFQAEILEEVRHVQRVEYDENIQARLEYLTHNLPALNQQIKPFEKCQEFRDYQQAKSHHYTEITLQRLEEARLSGLLDSVWDRRCPSEEIQDYSKLGKRKKKKEESSRSHNH
ncbi:uncharacterized protein LOC130934204 [Arachis stenosperma]|uniref:uncharacterized protein LOC130934204 n=1 Tax=Arachis stenosperma TaxID=217475 RepID=UPI0025AC0990|nr:uncharacterized protein LOC130934204 [Arachis stenosperma]